MKHKNAKVSKEDKPWVRDPCLVQTCLSWLALSQKGLQGGPQKTQAILECRAQMLCNQPFCVKYFI